MGIPLGCIGAMGKELTDHFSAGESFHFPLPNAGQWATICYWIAIVVLPFPSSSRTNVLAKHEFLTDGVPYEVTAMHTRAWGTIPALPRTAR